MLERRISRRELLRRGRNLGLTVAASSFLTACGTAVATSQQGDSTSGGSKHPKHLVMIVIDAGRADYLQYKNQLPNISRLMQTGTYFDRAWVGQMEATTPASHASIGSGCFPSHDGGILGFWWEDPNTGTTFNSVPLNGIDPDSLSNIMADAGTPTMAEFLKKHDSRAKVYTASGQKFYAADAVGGQHADYVSYFHKRGTSWCPTCMPGRELPASLISDLSVSDPLAAVADADPTHVGDQDRLVGELALNVIRSEHPRVVILNLPEMDWPVAHAWGGPEAPQMVLKLMQNADTVLGHIMDEYRAEGIYDDTVWIVMGDHGVTPTTQFVDQWAIKDAIQSHTPAIVVTIDSHTSCFVWLDQPRFAQSAAIQVEQNASTGINGVYYLAEQNGRQVYLPAPNTAAATHPGLMHGLQYLMSTMVGPTAPHVICIYPERTGTLNAGVAAGSTAWRGDHGGPSWGSQAIPLVIAGPGVKSNHVSHFPARLVDVAPTAMRLMGVPYPTTDGLVLADAMTSSLAADAARQRAAGRYLIPHAHAIQRHSARQAAQDGAFPRIQLSGMQHVGFTITTY
ncbi:MAG TPA: alkaline phosphatase family protein [Actinomycetota bacterium]|nr:alkaline phosphatase family protein [Actinomycetota bacterium]